MCITDVCLLCLEFLLVKGLIWPDLPIVVMRDLDREDPDLIEFVDPLLFLGVGTIGLIRTSFSLR